MNKLMMVEKEMQAQLNKNFPDFEPGDMIKVYHKITDKDKERTHILEGIVIRFGGEMQRKTFILRRISYGQGYEVLFPYYSPNIEKIELVRKARRHPRRSRLYYLRGREGREATNA